MANVLHNKADMGYYGDVMSNIKLIVREQNRVADLLANKAHGITHYCDLQYAIRY